MDPQVAGQLGMEGGAPRRALRDSSTGRPSWVASTSTSGPTRSTTGARMNTPGNAAGEARRRPGRLEGLQLGAVAVAAHGDVEHVEGRLVGPAVERRRWRSRITPAHVPRTGSPSREPARAAAASSSEVIEELDRSWSTRRPGRISASIAARSAGCGPRRSRRRARRAPHGAPGRPLGARATPTFTTWRACVGGPHAHQPRSASFTSRRADLVAAHRLAEPPRHLGHDRRVLVVGGGLDDRLGPRGRVGALEDAAADEHRLGAELHDERGVGRGGDPAGAEERDGQLAALGDLGDERRPGRAAPSPRRSARPRRRR